ncbi:MAG: methyl-accepting chemotaxis protein [Candidatus Omnitrophota bacterium]|nr:MAG: methyl-accepting chemotaxis protein [Candidatus Omnitrophota bacterium]
MISKRHRRRHYLIKKRFQLKYTMLILATLLLVMSVSGIGLYVGMWASIIENFSEFKVSQNLETAKRIAGYEGVRYKKGDYRLGRIFREAELLSGEQRKALKNALRAVNGSLLPKIALLGFLIFIGGIFISHKIAGPMYRFEQSAEAIKDGNLRVHFRIRKSDAMKKTASSLEDMAESLRLDIEKLKQAGTIEEARKIASKYKT